MTEKPALEAGGGLHLGRLRANPVPLFPRQRRQRHDWADHEPEFDHFAGIVEFDVIGAGIILIPGVPLFPVLFLSQVLNGLLP